MLSYSHSIHLSWWSNSECINWLIVDCADHWASEHCCSEWTSRQLADACLSTDTHWPSDGYHRAVDLPFTWRTSTKGSFVNFSLAN